jgi:hypothetical protein
LIEIYRSDKAILSEARSQAAAVELEMIETKRKIEEIMVNRFGKVLQKNYVGNVSDLFSVSKLGYYYNRTRVCNFKLRN